MDSRNLDKAMEIYALLISGETVGRQNRPDLYEAYNNQAEVYDLLDALIKKSNLQLCEYRNSLYVTAGDQNRVFGFSHEELKRAIGLRLNRELFLAYFIIYDIMTLFYENTASEAALTYVRTEMVIDSTTALLKGVMTRLPAISKTVVEENSFQTLALLWEDLPLVTDNEDLSTLKAARGSKTGFVKLVFNFLISQKLFAESGGKYYITERMQALIENYYNHNKGRLYEIISQSRMEEKGEEEDAAY